MMGVGSINDPHYEQAKRTHTKGKLLEAQKVHTMEQVNGWKKGGQQRR
jgi:hypothetical protein